MTLPTLLGRATCLLIDFDGPICAVFAGYPPSRVAAQLRTIVLDHFAGALPSDIEPLAASPLKILRQVADFGSPALTEAIGNACHDAELQAVATATPTAGADELLHAAHDAGLSVVIVSNNSSAAIESYLRGHDLTRYVQAVSARDDQMDPRLLKPHTFLLERGLQTIRQRPEHAAFIGDSTTDIEAGKAAGIATIGYANKPGKLKRLTDAGADTVIETMHAATTAIRTASAGLPT
ncbi:MAG: hypothetical protein QOH97_4468 [Actinoplanes sp.]|jgi:HAD superfamily hydrolase (TIGR01509 family)|nr:hypothetical protein [Actinoplanes sp.]